MNRKSNRWPLVIYDLAIMLALDLLMVLFYVTTQALSLQSVVLHGIVSVVCVFTARYLGKIYQQIWRYGGIQCYIRLLFTDAIAATQGVYHNVNTRKTIAVVVSNAV